MKIGDTVNIYPSCPEDHWKGKVTEIFKSDFSRGCHVVKVTEDFVYEYESAVKNGTYSIIWMVSLKTRIFNPKRIHIVEVPMACETRAEKRRVISETKKILEQIIIIN